jgi:2-polyprenyl-6-methoxyphenol hydroxylase-like FAD-dependent oxidoreductase
VSADGGVHDVAVIGGGIAGSAACIALARRGIRPLWIAPREVAARDAVGESLAPAARPILASLGLEQLLASPHHRASNITFSAWGSPRLIERHAAVHLEGPGTVLTRPVFNADIAAAAENVAERQQASLTSFEARDGLWRLALEADGRSEAAAARFVIDASGRAAVFARRLATYHREDQMVAAWAMLPHRDYSVDPTPATMIEVTSDGWFYASLLPDGRLSIAYFTDPDLLPANLSRELVVWRNLIAQTIHVSRWIDDAGFAIEAPPKLTSAGMTRLDPPASASEGWAAIGDAATAFDPLSSHGMTTALWTAAQAGNAAADWLACDRQTLMNYADAVSAGAERVTIARREIYAREKRFTGSPFWHRRRQDA